MLDGQLARCENRLQKAHRLIIEKLVARLLHWSRLMPRTGLSWQIRRDRGGVNCSQSHAALWTALEYLKSHIKVTPKTSRAQLHILSLRNAGSWTEKHYLS